MNHHNAKPPALIGSRHAVAGNMFVYILGAIFLMGILIVASKGNMQEGVGIDEERAVLSVTRVQRYVSEINSGVNAILSNGYSETDLRFALPETTGPYGDIENDRKRQVFAPEGGNVEYQLPPAGVNDGTPWQFYANTHITDIGTDLSTNKKAELLAVLPNVTKSFCGAVNSAANQKIDLSLATDPSSGGCVYDSTVFTGAYGSGAGVNTPDPTKFTSHPAYEACVKCESDGKFHYYRVLLGR